MSYILERETQSWNLEVEIEAARLIKRGVSPYEATKKAAQIVSYRRKLKEYRDVADEG